MRKARQLAGFFTYSILTTYKSLHVEYNIPHPYAGGPKRYCVWPNALAHLKKRFLDGVSPFYKS